MIKLLIIVSGVKNLEEDFWVGYDMVKRLAGDC